MERENKNVKGLSVVELIWIDKLCEFSSFLNVAFFFLRVYLFSKSVIWYGYCRHHHFLVSSQFYSP